MKSLDRITYSPSKHQAQQAQFERIKALQASLKPAKPTEVAKIADKVELTSSFSGEEKIEAPVTYKPLVHTQVQEIQELQHVIETNNASLVEKAETNAKLTKALGEQVEYAKGLEKDINRLLEQHEADNAEFGNMEAHIGKQDVLLYEANTTKEALQLELTEVSTELERLHAERVKLLELQETNAKLMDKLAFYQEENEQLVGTVASLTEQLEGTRIELDEAKLARLKEFEAMEPEQVRDKVVDKLNSMSPEEIKKQNGDSVSRSTLRRVRSEGQLPLLHEAKLSVAELLQENWEEFVQLEQLPKEAREKVLERKFMQALGKAELIAAPDVLVKIKSIQDSISAGYSVFFKNLNQAINSYFTKERRIVVENYNTEILNLVSNKKIANEIKTSTLTPHPIDYSKYLVNLHTELTKNNITNKECDKLMEIPNKILIIATA